MRKENIWIGNMYRINLYYIDYQIAIEKEKTMKGINPLNLQENMSFYLWEQMQIEIPKNAHSG